MSIIKHIPLAAASGATHMLTTFPLPWILLPWQLPLDTPSGYSLWILPLDTTPLDTTALATPSGYYCPGNYSPEYSLWILPLDTTALATPSGYSLWILLPMDTTPLDTLSGYSLDTPYGYYLWTLLPWLPLDTTIWTLYTLSTMTSPSHHYDIITSLPPHLSSLSPSPLLPLLPLP